METNKTDSTLQFVIIPKQTNDPFFYSAGLGCKSRSEQLGNNVVECHYIGSSDADAIEQAKIVKELITDPAKHNLTRPPDGIVISVIDEDVTGEAINFVVDFGIPVITFDSDAPQSKRQAFIGTDNYMFGFELGKILNQVNPTGSYYGIITSPSPNLQLRVDGLRKRLQGDYLEPTNWKEVDYSPLNCEMNTTLAIEQMYRYASDPNIKAIVPVGGWPMFDETLWMNFVDNTKSKIITTVVADATSQQVELMNRDYVNGLVGQMPHLMGNFSVDEMLRIVKRQSNKSEHMSYNATIIKTPLVEISRIPDILPTHVVNLNQIGSYAIFGYVAFAIVAISSIGVAIWVWFDRNTNIVRSSQPSFLLMICAGTLILGSSIIPLTFDDQNSNQEAADIACMSFPWLLFLGFTTAFASLFSKTWRIHQIFKNAKSFRRVQVTPRDVLMPYIVLMVVNVITLLCWTFISPSKYVRLPLPGTDDWNRVISSYGACSSKHSGAYGGALPYIIILLCVSGTVLVIANIYAYRSRDIQTDYAESRYIAIIMSSILQVSLIGFPVAALVVTNPKAYFMILVSLIFIISMDILCFVFIPKIFAIRTYRQSLIKEQGQNRNESRFKVAKSKNNAKSGLKYSINKNGLMNIKIDELNDDEKEVFLDFLSCVTDSKDDERKRLIQVLLDANNNTKNDGKH